MPYVGDDIRSELDEAILQLAKLMNDPSTQAITKPEGSMNYVITRLVLQRLYGDKDVIVAGKSLSYARINEIIGVLECAKLELYRMHASKYEDMCIVKNGDVGPKW